MRKKDGDLEPDTFHVIFLCVCCEKVTNFHCTTGSQSLLLFEKIYFYIFISNCT